VIPAPGPAAPAMAGPSGMHPSAREALVREILPWRDAHCHEMGCPIVHDSLHARGGWTRPQLLRLGETLMG